MQKLIIKLFIFSIPIIILYNIPKFAHYSFSSVINKKINSLIENNNEPMIIVGGDSRAEEQIISSILERRLGVKTVNIGISGGDIAILYNALMAHNLINKDNTLIISISSTEANDNIIYDWSISQAYVTYISTIDNIRLFGKRYLNMMHERMKLIFKELLKLEVDIKLNPTDNRIETDGFVAVSGDISNFDFQGVDIYNDTSKVFWYIDSKHDGIRKKVLNKMIGKIADTGMNVILIQSPVTPSWLERTKNTYIDSIELNHSKFLKNISAQYDNISFIDFYTNQSTVYHDSMYYNIVHFNFKGAEIFTNTLLDSLMYRNLLKRNID
ncbi:MAG: hypothetical protein GWP19_11770 [Planctomycetia bacterium]|nr:hypothetical protein [Planctomycetia bacterium]